MKRAHHQRYSETRNPVSSYFTLPCYPSSSQLPRCWSFFLPALQCVSYPMPAPCWSFFPAVSCCAAALNMTGPSATSTLDLVKEDVLAVLTNVVIFILGCWTWELLHRKIFFVCCRYCCTLLRPFVLLLFGYFIHTPIAYAVLFALMFWLVILCSEVVVNEIREVKSQRSSVAWIKIGQTMNQYWNVAAVLRPSYLDCDVWYYPVVICDTSVPHDPFWPNHVSTIFIVEWRRRNMIWTTVRIWQVSLLNGGKKNVQQFDQFWPQTDGRPFKYGCTRAKDIDCFQSRGVIFIMMRRFEDRAIDYAMLFVYDTRLEKSAVYDMKIPDPLNVRTFSITCIGRTLGTDGSLEGWRIRMLSAAGLVMDELPAYRARVINETWKLRQEAFLVRSEEIVFGQFFGTLFLRPICTSRGHFGIQAKGSFETESPIVLFNEATTEYAIFRTIDDLILMDNRLATYVYSFPDHPTFPIYSYGTHLWPVFWNDSEAIIAWGVGLVSRTTFRPSSLKYQAAKSLFHSNPQLRTRLNAEQFRQATGIGGMEGHFG